MRNLLINNEKWIDPEDDLALLGRRGSGSEEGKEEEEETGRERSREDKISAVGTNACALLDPCGGHVTIERGDLDFFLRGEAI